ncbi:hypothetical protein PKOR_19485 [Pontibacter korlensis]|uniref:DinB-like domain-containing protein n=2 Tax=Pontibacter korlensis TaxID=400092 RepID=A0A0E3UZ99_9BACT|nr:hypothetical protein PKOR_19485 [Pontibacter korlensis]
MNPKLEVKYLRLEQSRNRLLDELAGLSDEQLNTYPAAGKWSINQHVAHLVLVEERALSSIKQQLQQQDTLLDIDFSTSVKALLVKLALHSGRKYKAPAAVANVPDQAALPELRQQWDKLRFELEDELTSFPHHLLEKGVLNHPMVGCLSINQALSFLQDHFEHHRQIMLRQKEALIS